MPKFFTKNPAPKQHSHQEEEDQDSDLLKTFLSWTAPSRPFRKKDRSYYTTIAILVVLLILISLLAREIILIGVLLALAFVAYVLGFVPPEDIEYKISTQGITIGDHFYFWQDLDSFWFSQKDGHQVLNILTHFRFPAQLMIMLGDQKEEEVKRSVARYLPFHEIAPKTMIDKWADGLQKHFPLENPQR